MNKPIAITIKETKDKLVNICNESSLPPVILDLIVYGIYSEVHALAEKQISEDEEIYAKITKDKDIKDDSVNNR